MNKSKSSKSFAAIDFKSKNSRILMDTLSSLLLSNRSKSKQSIQCFTARSEKVQDKQIQIQKSFPNAESPKRLKFNIKTFIRFKPTKYENFEKSDKILIPNNKQILCEDNLYTYDYIFQENSKQKQVYNLACKELVNHFMNGFNATVFAYGQTGSGKTHTMFGNLEVQNKNGVIPLAIEDVFDLVENYRKANTCFTISCSMLQIYRQVLIDLFAIQKRQLKIRQNRSIFNIQGLSLREPKSAKQVLEFIKAANQIKKIRQTNLNEVSSRSHLIFTLYLQVQQNGYKRVSKLNLIDLAGCQKVHKSKVQGQGLEQAKKINFSLACLGNTINSLLKGNQHIPYRDSKLTRLLQDSLSGNSLTTLIVTCSQQSETIQQTLSSLKFASRAKLLKTNPLLSTYKKSQKTINLAIYENLKSNYCKCLNKINQIKDLIKANQKSIQYQRGNYNDAQLFDNDNDNNNNNDKKGKKQIVDQSFSSVQILRKIQQILQDDYSKGEIMKTNYSCNGPNPFQLILQKGQNEFLSSVLEVKNKFERNNAQVSQQNVKNQQIKYHNYNDSNKFSSSSRINNKVIEQDEPRVQTRKMNANQSFREIQRYLHIIKEQQASIQKLKIQIQNIKSKSFLISSISKVESSVQTTQHQKQSIKNKIKFQSSLLSRNTSPNILKDHYKQKQNIIGTKRKSICLNVNVKRQNSTKQKQKGFKNQHVLKQNQRQSQRQRQSKHKMNIDNASQNASNQLKAEEFISLLKWIQQRSGSYTTFQKQILVNQIDLLVNKTSHNHNKDNNMVSKQIQNKVEDKQKFIYQSKYISLLEKALLSTDLSLNRLGRQYQVQGNKDSLIQIKNKI